MACDGYEHGSPIQLMYLLPEEPNIPVGTIGIVININREGHTIDVNLLEYGIYRNINAHLFQKINQPFNEV
jgi:hypothetical protein